MKKLIAGALLLGAATLAMAQAWPTAKPIRLIVGYPPGGGIDFAARTVQVPLQELLKQQIVVDYKPGAGGMLAATELTRAAPDGYTLLLANTGPFAIAPYFGDTIFSGITTASNCSSVTKPNSIATCFKVLFSL